MPSDRFRSKVVSKLVEEIERLNGSVFEQFGYRVMPLLHPGRWEHRGTTVDGASRGYTVDTSTAAAECVGEMGSEAGYFDDMTKPLRDLAHAVSLHPQVEHIWLLSSRTASAGQTTDIANATADFLRANPTVVTADILDARAIANEIYSHLGRKDLVQSLAGALPVVERLADEYAFSHAIPSVHSLVERTAMEAEIRDALRSRALVILKGMSGAGKSALAARVATAVQGEYDNVIWVDAREIDNLATLSNVDVTRSGFSHNVKTLLTHDQILLVLDDPRFALNDLEHLEKGTSKVIVTSQAGAGPDIVDVRDVEEAEAVAILTQDIVTPCPPDLAAMVRSSVGGHALVLRALNRLAKAHGWAAVQECIETDSIAGLEDETHKKVLRRVLRRQATELSEEIGFVHWCNAPRFHIELARLVSTLAIENLEKRGFLAATTPGYVRVHELVFKAIVAEHATTPAQEERLALRMADFIREESETDRSLGSGSPPVKSCGWI